MFQITYRLGDDKLRVTMAQSARDCARQVVLIRMMGAIGVRVVRPLDRAVNHFAARDAMSRATATFLA